MASEIKVPSLGESVTEATVARWLKQPGEAVAIDDPVVELETDKVTIEVPAPAAGVLSEIAVKDGETGFVVDPEDPTAAAQALMRLLSDQLLARRLGQAGRKAVETNYNWDRVVRDLREIESQVSS